MSHDWDRFKELRNKLKEVKEDAYKTQVVKLDTINIIIDTLVYLLEESEGFYEGPPDDIL